MQTKIKKSQHLCPPCQRGTASMSFTKEGIAQICSDVCVCVRVCVDPFVPGKHNRIDLMTGWIAIFVSFRSVSF